MSMKTSCGFHSLKAKCQSSFNIHSYFLHGDDYAGLSAFINQPAADSERNAIMLAVGVLVPLSYGRMGKSWKHAEGLKELARSVRGNLEDFSA